MHRFNKLRIMKDETIGEIRDRYKDGISKLKLSTYYKVPLKTISGVVAGVKKHVKRSPDFVKARNKKEEIIRMYLNGAKKVDIEAKTGISEYFVSMFVNDLEKATLPTKNVTSNIEAIRRQEAKLISMAEELAKGNGSETTYKTLLSVHAAAEPFHGGVFDV